MNSGLMTVPKSAKKKRKIKNKNKNDGSKFFFKVLMSPSIFVGRDEGKMAESHERNGFCKNKNDG